MNPRIVLASIWAGCFVLALVAIELYVGRWVGGYFVLTDEDRLDAIWPVAAAYGGYLGLITLLWRLRPFRPSRSKELARFQFALALFATVALNAWMLYLIGRSHFRASDIGGPLGDIHAAARLAAWGAILVATANAVFFGTRLGPADGRAPGDEDEECASDQITVLFIANNPLDTQRLRLDKEYAQISKSLRASAAGHRINALNPGLVSRSALGQEILEHQASIVHFSGHGDETGRLLFEDANGASAPASTAALAELFRLLKGTVRCVVLNACFSRAQAEEIRKHVDCVIGMSVEIADQSAIDFAAAFYGALGAGMSMQEAFEFGCQAIEARGVIETAGARDATPGELGAGNNPPDDHNHRVPVLLCRDRIDPNTIKLLGTDALTSASHSRSSR